MGAGGDDSSAATKTREPISLRPSDVVINGERAEAVQEADVGADESSDANARPPEKLLRPDDIREGLQHLGPTASGLRQAYLRLSVSSLQLTSLVGVERFSHLQTLIASRNNIGDDVRCLGSLRSLTHLDLSHNRLTTILDGVLPQPLSLRYLDVSNNMISNVEGLASYRHLEEVHLGDNRIEDVQAETMQALPILKTLTLRRNKLRSLHGVRSASTLKHLDVSENALAKINDLRGLTTLTYLDISGNGLLTLGTMEELPLLGTLLMGDNCISSLNGLLPIQKLTYLRRLAVKGNTLMQAHKARLHILYLLPSLTLLDGSEVRIEDKVEAANLHGADIEGLRSIRAKFFPNRADEAQLLAPDEHSLGNAASSSVSTMMMATTNPNANASAAATGTCPGTTSEEKAYYNSGVDGMSDDVDELNFIIPLDDLIDASEFGAYVLKNTSNQREAARACFDWMTANTMSPGPRYKSIADAAVPEDSPLLRPDRCSAEVEAMLCCGLGGVNEDEGQEKEEEELASDDDGMASASMETSGNVKVDSSGGAPADASASSSSFVDSDTSVETAANDVGDMQKRATSGPWSLRIAELYARLAASCGLECTIVRGVARFPGMPVGRIINRSNHHWNVVTIDSQRCIVDCAWASAGLDPDGFCIPPDEFVYQRFPEDPRDQLLDACISVQQFWSLPCLQPAFFAHNLRLQNHATSIVSVPAGSSEVNISVAAPADVTLYHEFRHGGVPSTDDSIGEASASSRAVVANTPGAAVIANDDDSTLLRSVDKQATAVAVSVSQETSATDDGGNRTLAQRDLDGSFILRTALSGFSASYINVFAYSAAQMRSRLVLCYRIFREPPRVFDDSGRDNLHTLPIKVHSTDMDGTNLCYPIVSREFTKKGTLLSRFSPCLVTTILHCSLKDKCAFVCASEGGLV